MPVEYTYPNLPRLDPPINYKDMDPDFLRWVSNLVDTFNQSMEEVEKNFSDVP